MIRHRLPSMLAVILLPALLKAQPTNDNDSLFCRPLDLPVLLAANFGELRPNHFHSGLDYRTQGTTGHPVRSVADGYVARIRVSPVGYGKALYIAHPGGYTTVYGHLDAYTDAIADYVYQQQYDRHSFDLDINLDSTVLPVKRGQIVALSGNTGGSAGPHLHFEVRETVSEEVVNPLFFNFGVTDRQPPTIRRLAVVPIGERSMVNGSHEKMVIPVVRKGNDYHLAHVIDITGDAGFAVEAFDQLSGTQNKCGIYHLSLQVDGDTIFSQTINRFSFDDTRYINSLIDYGYWIEHHVMLNRLFIEVNNRLRYIYDRHQNRGIMTFANEGTHNVTITAADMQGNRCRLAFHVRYTPLPKQPEEEQPSWMRLPDFILGNCGSEQKLQYPGVKVTIPADALYSPVNLTISASRRLPSLYSPVYHIHDRRTPLQNPITINIAADSLPARLRTKALLVQVNPATGKLVSAGGTFGNNTVTTRSYTFGSFAIAVDTVAPTIRPINIKNGSRMHGKPNIRIRISDNLSGIDSVNGTIDGEWVLFEYDAKRAMLTYTFDPRCLNTNTHHRLRLELTDMIGNLAVYEAGFYW